jgi:AcrR family transcriptional regulator
MKSEVRAYIIKVAQETFTRFGFRKTTMDEIAFAARKGKSSLYYYFKSKEDVFQAVVEKEANNLFNEIQKTIDNENTARGKIRAYIYTRMIGFRNFGNLYEAIKDDFLSNMEFVDKIRFKYDKNEITTLSEIIQLGIDQNELRPQDATHTAEMIVIALKGLEIRLMLHKSEPRNYEKMIDDMLEILFNGIAS